MYDKPNTTPFPDELIDRDLRNLSGSETKIIAVIIRKTFGFHKVWDFISLSQIKDLTGLEAATIVTAAAKLEEEKFINIAHVCPRCDNIVEYHTKKQDKDYDHTCPFCKTKEPPSKWYALNIYGADMEKYLKETLKIKQNKPNQKGSSKIELLNNSVVQKLNYGSSKIELPPVFKKDSVLDSDSNVLQETTTQRGSSKIELTINNTINNVQKTSSSSSVNLNVHKNSENQNEKKDEEEEFFLQKRKAEEILKKTLVTKKENIYEKCMFLDEDLKLVGQHEEGRIEKVAKTAMRRNVEKKMIPEYILNGLLNYDSLYKEKKKHLDIPPGLVEHEKFKEKYEATDFEAGKEQLGKIFSMLDEKEKEDGQLPRINAEACTE